MIRMLLLAASLAAIAAPIWAQTPPSTPDPPVPATTPPPPIEAPSPVRRVVDGIWLVEGSIRPGRGPDGNTVILEGPEGVVVFDTGRNPWHRASIFAWMYGNDRTPTAIVNSHWHLDHATGNLALKDEYPGLLSYAGNGMDAALQGMLLESLTRNRGIMAGTRGTPTQRQNAARSLAALEEGQRLRADVVIEDSGPREIGGLMLEVHLVRNAATDTDVWLRDPRTNTVMVGDLITFPSPFLDTACTGPWRAALDAIAETEFDRVIPGHGEVLNRAGFETYRAAFGAYVDCANSDSSAETCGENWFQAVESLVGLDPVMREAARSDAAEYITEVLRRHGGNSSYCRAAEAA